MHHLFCITLSLLNIFLLWLWLVTNLFLLLVVQHPTFNCSYWVEWFAFSLDYHNKQKFSFIAIPLISFFLCYHILKFIFFLQNLALMCLSMFTVVGQKIQNKCRSTVQRCGRYTIKNWRHWYPGLVLTTAFSSLNFNIVLPNCPCSERETDICIHL